MFLVFCVTNFAIKTLYCNIFRPTQKLKELKVAEFGVEHPKEFVEGAECLSIKADSSNSDPVYFPYYLKKRRN